MEHRFCSHSLCLFSQQRKKKIQIWSAYIVKSIIDMVRDLGLLWPHFQCLGRTPCGASVSQLGYMWVYICTAKLYKVYMYLEDDHFCMRGFLYFSRTTSIKRTSIDNQEDASDFVLLFVVRELIRTHFISLFFPGLHSNLASCKNWIRYF